MPFLQWASHSFLSYNKINSLVYEVIFRYSFTELKIHLQHFSVVELYLKNSFLGDVIHNTEPHI